MKVVDVIPGGPADLAGIRPGDVLVEANGRPVRDEIDLLYHTAGERAVLAYRRGEDCIVVPVQAGVDAGAVYEPMQPEWCGNRCIFCFVDQNPPGMRRAVYVRDEDFRLSFLHGSYITLTAVSEEDIARIVEQRLSPLHVSVHAVNPEVRRRLLGLRRDDRLLEKIGRLTAAGIVLHCQIVVCPGINDGPVLEETIRTLRGFYPGIATVAVVPVGLTRHRAGLPPIRPLDRDMARTIIRLVNRLRAAWITVDGFGFAYCADELYLRAEKAIPRASYYDDFEQYGNGIGMLRSFLDGLSRLSRRKHPPVPPGRYILVTGISMVPFVDRYAVVLSRFPGVDARAVAVPNRFYGDTVTVAGLLAGADIADAVGAEPDETLVLPPSCLNADGLFLDDMTVAMLSRRTGAPVLLGGDDPGAPFTPPD